MSVLKLCNRSKVPRSRNRYSAPQGRQSCSVRSWSGLPHSRISRTSAARPGVSTGGRDGWQCARRRAAHAPARPRCLGPCADARGRGSRLRAAGTRPGGSGGRAKSACGPRSAQTSSFARGARTTSNVVARSSTAHERELDSVPIRMQLRCHASCFHKPARLLSVRTGVRWQGPTSERLARATVEPSLSAQYRSCKIRRGTFGPGGPHGVCLHDPY